MVHSGGVRSFVKTAAVCALVLSTLPSIQAKGVVTAGPKLQSKVVSCDVSEGDKSFGIQAISDATCAKGGLGCYSKQCRYCKVLDTPKSSHLENCLSHGVAFTSMGPVTVAQGPCEVSSGDVAAGISAVTDSGCLYGGLGCYNDHCRFCKAVETPQSAGFMACSSLDRSYSTPVSTTVASATTSPTIVATNAPATLSPVVTVAPTAAPTEVPSSSPTEAPTLDVTDAPTAAPTEAPTLDVTDAPAMGPTDIPAAQTTCSVVPSAGDLEGGVSIVTDPLCASGGIGCLSDVCRFCKLRTTPQSDPYMDCTLVGMTTAVAVAPAATPVPDTPFVTRSATDAPASSTETPVATTATPVDDTEVPTEVPDDSTEVPVTPDPTTQAPTMSTESSASTSSDAVTELPVLTMEAPVKTPAPLAKCTLAASAGDAEVGISVATDPSCSLGGLGCIDEICRFCKLTTTIQSAPYLDCVLIENGSPKSEAPVLDVTVPPAVVSTETPSTTTETPVVATEAPDATTKTPVVTDAATESPDTTTDTPDAATEAPVTEAPDTTETPVLTPVSSANALPVQETCGIVATAGDIAVGVHIETDVTCSTGGIGCINDLCRFCKVEITPQSTAFVDCSSRVVDTAAPVDPTAATPIATITTPPASCDLVASTGDAAVGIRVVTDSTCSVGGVGCISDVCRFCKVITSIQSAAFVDCVTVNGYTPETEAPVASTMPDVTTSTPASEASCSRIASEGDLTVGVSIATDDTCRSGGVGCIDDVCRFCQVTATPESTAFVSCTSLSGYTPRSEAPVDAATMSPLTPSTNSPVSQASCDLVVSAGDAAVGISIAGDTTCAVGGAGCIDSVCRFCKVKTTVQSAAFVDCISIAGFLLTSDIPVDTMTPSIDSTTTTTSATPASCSLVASEGDTSVGIDITADTACQFGGVGCIDNVCRFCKVKTTEQSAGFVDCPVSSNEPASGYSAPSGATPTLADGNFDANVDTSDASSLPADASETPIDTADIPQSVTTGDIPKATDATTDTSAATSDAAVPPVDTTEPTKPANAASDAADLTDLAGADNDDIDAGTEAPAVIMDAADSEADLPQDDDTSNAIDYTVDGSDDENDDTVTKSPAAAINVTDTSDLLTEAPVTTSEPPTTAPVETADDYDDWEGSGESADADSDSNYFDSDESLGGI